MPFLIRVLWFFLIGWHITFWWVLAAWFLNLTIIGLPVGLWMLNRVPLVLTLRTESSYRVTQVQDGGITEQIARAAATRLAAAPDLFRPDRLVVQPDLGFVGLVAVCHHHRAAVWRLDAQPAAGGDDVDEALDRSLSEEATMDPIEKAKGQMGGVESLISKLPGVKGYREKEMRRDADKQMRDALALQLSDRRDEDHGHAKRSAGGRRPAVDGRHRAVGGTLAAPDRPGQDRSLRLLRLLRHPAREGG